MALYTTVGAKNIPEGSIRLSKSEALEFQKKVIWKWHSFTDVAFLQYGWIASSAVTMASSFYITRLIRSLLNIGPQATKLPYFFSLIPITASGLWTEKKVTERTLLMSTKCPMCLQLKFSLFQTMVGVIFPTLASLTFYLPVAQLQNTITLPDIKNDTREGFKFCFKLLKTRALQFQIVAALQIPLVFVLPYVQAKQLENINQILRSKNNEDLE